MRRACSVATARKRILSTAKKIADYVDYQPLDSQEPEFPSDNYPENEDEFNSDLRDEEYGNGGYERREPRNPNSRGDFEY